MEMDIAGHHLPKEIETARSAQLVRVVAPRFVAGFVIRGGRVVEAAPILRRWLLGKTTDDAWRTIGNQGWKGQVIP